MEQNDKILKFWGSWGIYSPLPLADLSVKISDKLFNGMKFTFGERSIWEEIPSMYIDASIFGMFIILGGYPGKDGYSLDIGPYGEFTRYISRNNLNDRSTGFDISLNIYCLLKQSFEYDAEVEIQEPLDWGI